MSRRLREFGLIAQLCAPCLGCDAPAPAKGTAASSVSAPANVPAATDIAAPSVSTPANVPSASPAATDIAAPSASPAAPDIAAPSALTPASVPAASAPATGLGACDSLPLECARAIASRKEDDRTIVFLTLGTEAPARPGQWVHCQHEDRPPSPPCEVLDIVDRGGMLEASCLAAAPDCSPGAKPSRREAVKP